MLLATRTLHAKNLCAAIQRASAAILVRASNARNVADATAVEIAAAVAVIVVVVRIAVDATVAVTVAVRASNLEAALRAAAREPVALQATAAINAVMDITADTDILRRAVRN